jgi:hypothetical protein
MREECAGSFAFAGARKVPCEPGKMQVPFIRSMRVHTWRFCLLSCSLSLLSKFLSFRANARLGSIVVQAGAYGAQANDVCKRYSSRSVRRRQSRSAKVSRRVFEVVNRKRVCGSAEDASWGANVDFGLKFRITRWLVWEAGKLRWLAAATTTL